MSETLIPCCARPLTHIIVTKGTHSYTDTHTCSRVQASPEESFKYQGADEEWRQVEKSEEGVENILFSHHLPL